MTEVIVDCDGRLYEIGFIHGARPEFKANLVFQAPLAFLLGFLAGTAMWLGRSWTIVTDGDVMIEKLSHRPRIAPTEHAQTLRLLNIECNSDQLVEAIVLDEGSFVVIAQPGAIVGIPAGTWKFSFS